MAGMPDGFCAALGFLGAALPGADERICPVMAVLLAGGFCGRLALPGAACERL